MRPATGADKHWDVATKKSYPSYPLTINGREWAVVLRPPRSKKNVGQCMRAKRELHVTPGAQQDTTLRHEVLHVLLPRRSEEFILAVERALYDATKGLIELGEP